MKSRIYITRHGESQWNVEGKVQLNKYCKL